MNFNFQLNYICVLFMAIVSFGFLFGPSADHPYGYAKMPDPQLPIVRDHEGILKHKGQEVRVVGIYTDVIVKMSRYGEKLKPEGHVAVKLSDGTMVLLFAPGDPDAIRSKRERRKLRRKQVVVQGIIYPYVPIEGNAPEGPCMIKIRSIKRLK